MGYEKEPMQEDIIEEKIKNYNHNLKIKAKNQKEIEDLKEKINILQIKCNELDLENNNTENFIQAEMYKKYSTKDLLILVNTAEKFAKKSIAIDFKELVQKFDEHNLGINDISQLQTYIKMYGNYVAREHSIIKGFFKAFGGKEDG